VSVYVMVRVMVEIKLDPPWSGIDLANWLGGLDEETAKNIRQAARREAEGKIAHTVTGKGRIIDSKATLITDGDKESP